MGRQRDPAQIARDRRRIADLYLQGWIQADIAAECEINQSTVSRDLKALHQQWLDSALVDISFAKAQELAKIDRLEREYWTAWERSCENAETETRKAKGKARQYQDEETGQFVAEQPAEVTKQSKGQAGDPRFLAGVQWCIERRCKLLGIDAPQKLEHSGAVDLIMVDWDDANGTES